MSPVDYIAIALGLILIIVIIWFFFGSKGKSATTAAITNGVQQVLIKVVGGYSPSVIRLKRGSKARLIFDRQETSSCSEEVVLPDFKIRQRLPAFKKTTIELMPASTGEFEFSCGMGMLHGKIIVE